MNKHEGFSPVKHSRLELALLVLVVLLTATVVVIEKARGQPTFTYDLLVMSKSPSEPEARKVFTSEPGSCLRGPLKIYGDNEIVLFELGRGIELPNDCGAEEVMQLFVDMDGVLADFDRHHEAVFGIRPDKIADNVDWQKVRNHAGFYSQIPMMEDLPELWSYIRPFNPTVLTGIPKSVIEAEANKRGWVRNILGPSVPVICCPSKEKSRYCDDGDILIDDWEKYKNLWLDRGGRWVTHTSAANTIAALKAMGL